ncbi:hypothetical protein FQN60_008925 [Etheostoma spectabile]|uniref:MAT1 centre domain-containing protein n=1 Tax=Etheostoma spectabile TaxID=54343 RepID=A0A5J5CN70_9PERO|nr:hypothetical protein FQN60_008925 [Etheostoma spectabile]
MNGLFVGLWKQAESLNLPPYGQAYTSPVAWGHNEHLPLPGCENCVEMLFVRGSGNCVQCDTPLRKSNFRVQLFEDPTVDKEVEIRKKVLKIYNKRDFDFPSLREYNDYLEQLEDIGRTYAET